jgi:hypothetical protein
MIGGHSRAPETVAPETVAGFFPFLIFAADAVTISIEPVGIVGAHVHRRLSRGAVEAPVVPRGRVLIPNVAVPAVVPAVVPSANDC